MFGYVVINKPELKIKDFDQYQEYYCGLCQSLKKNHGRLSQFTLNYDLNFVGILLSSLYEPHENHYFIHCPIHPFHKKRVCTNECMDYVSDMTIILTYYKLEDDILDENSLKSKSLIQFIKKKFKIVKNKYPQKVETIKEHLDQIHYLEQTNCMDLDKIAGHFGHIMAEICVYQEDIFKDDLYQMGFYLGKFIYLIDAFEDVEEDLKKQTYNPFKDQFKEDNFQDYCFKILEMMISRSSYYFEKLPLIKNIELLKNIIYSGIWTKFELIKKKRMEEQS